MSMESWNDRIASYLKRIAEAIEGASGGSVRGDDSVFEPGTDKVGVIGAFFDDVSPDTVDEGDVGVPRMSSRRELYVQLRDAAGNERGLEITSDGEAEVVEKNSGDIKAAVEIIDDWDATHDSAVVLDGPQIMVEAKDFDGSAFPNVVDEGDAVRLASSLSGVQYVKLVSEDGSQSVEDEVNNVLKVRETDAEAQNYDSPITLHDAVQLDDSPTSDVSGSVAIGSYSSKTLFISITKTGSPTNVSLWLEFSPDGTNWYGQDSATEGVRMIDSNGNSVTQIQYTASVEDVAEIPGWALYMRSNLTATGTDASNYFTCTVILGCHGR